jgi:hypothetical protein
VRITLILSGFVTIVSVDRSSNAQLELTTSSGSNSAVECDLAKVEVAGSNPVSRSTILRRRLTLRDWYLS